MSGWLRLWWGRSAIGLALGAGLIPYQLSYTARPEGKEGSHEPATPCRQRWFHVQQRAVG